MQSEQRISAHTGASFVALMPSNTFDILCSSSECRPTGERIHSCSSENERNRAWERTHTTACSASMSCTHMCVVKCVKCILILIQTLCVLLKFQMDFISCSKWICIHHTAHAHAQAYTSTASGAIRRRDTHQMRADFCARARVSNCTIARKPNIPCFNHRSEFRMSL